MDTRDPFELEIMRAGVDYRFAVQFGSVKLMLRPLASSEMVEAYGQVAQYMASLPDAQRTEVAENTWRAREFLKRASSQYGQSLGQITDVHLNAMTNKQIMALYREWLAIEDRINPDIEDIPAERLELLVETIKKNPKEDWGSQLTELSFGVLLKVALFSLTPRD